MRTCLRLLTAAAALLASALPGQVPLAGPPPPAAPGMIAAGLRALDPAFAAWDVGVNGRIRGEDKAGAGATDAGSAGDFSRRPSDDNRNRYVLSRLLARAGYNGRSFTALLETRVSTSWGDERFNPAAPGRGLSENDAGADLHQVNVVIGGATAPVSLKLGRQELAYGDQRVIGAARWNNLGRTFDAAKLRWQAGGANVDAFTGGVVYLDSGNRNRSIPQDRFSGLYATWPGWRQRETVEAYLLARNVRRDAATVDWGAVPSPARLPGAQDVYTTGVRLKSRPGATGAWDYGLELMGQWGNRAVVSPSATPASARSAPRLRHRAGALVAQAGHTWAAVRGQPRVSVTYSHGSGDRDAGDGRSGTYQQMFPTGHLIYGLTDLSCLQNLEDIRAGVNVRPLAALSLTLDVRQQALSRTSDAWYNGGGAPRNTPTAAPGSGSGFRINPTYGRQLGREVALIATWTFSRAVQVEAGAARYVRGDYVRQSLAAVGSKDAGYAYLQGTLNL